MGRRESGKKGERGMGSGEERGGEGREREGRGRKRRREGGREGRGEEGRRRRGRGGGKEEERKGRGGEREEKAEKKHNFNILNRKHLIFVGSGENRITHWKRFKSCTEGITMVAGYKSGVRRGRGGQAGETEQFRVGGQEVKEGRRAR